MYHTRFGTVWFDRDSNDYAERQKCGVELKKRKKKRENPEKTGPGNIWFWCLGETMERSGYFDISVPEKSHGFDFCGGYWEMWNTGVLFYVEVLEFQYYCKYFVLQFGERIKWCL